mmetsp:Transcript_22516/g.47283  ORF Transcript_22516/g.47283 Transcript_22516/m.47283 type:complete len:90 (+) Transcript_22516:1969-2238(+)
MKSALGTASLEALEKFTAALFCGDTGCNSLSYSTVTATSGTWSGRSDSGLIQRDMTGAALRGSVRHVIPGGSWLQTRLFRTDNLRLRDE